MLPNLNTGNSNYKCDTFWGKVANSIRVLQREGLFLKCHKVVQVAKKMFISKVIQLNKAAHKNELSSYGVCMGRFGTPKMLVYEYKKGQWCKERKTRGKIGHAIFAINSPSFLLFPLLNIYFHGEKGNRGDGTDVLVRLRAGSPCDETIISGVPPGISTYNTISFGERNKCDEEQIVNAVLVCRQLGSRPVRRTGHGWLFSP
jgi:hypothetical protein